MLLCVFAYDIVFVRGKKPTEDMISLAEEAGIAMLTTDLRMYVACGLLYANGLMGANSSEDGTV